jgi:hypothetical protein
MDDGSCINFFYALEYPGLEFGEGLDSDVPKKAVRPLPEQGFDDVEPGAVFRRQQVLEAIGATGQECLRFFGNMGRNGCPG